MSDVVLLGVGNKGVALSAIVWYRYQPPTETVEEKPGKPARLRILTFAKTVAENVDKTGAVTTRSVNETVVFVDDEADQMLALLKKHTEQPA